MKFRFERWEKTRSKGKWNYIFKYGVLFWGLGTAVLYSLFFSLFNKWCSFLEVLPLSIVLFPLGGIGYGVATWYSNEKVYHKLKNPQKTFDTIIDFISKMYKDAELVHGDVSAFNVLIHKNKPYIIDFGQGVLVEHPNSLEFLKRDIYNIVSYFKRLGVKADEIKIFEEITKKS